MCPQRFLLLSPLVPFPPPYHHYFPYHDEFYQTARNSMRRNTATPEKIVLRREKKGEWKQNDKACVHDSSLSSFVLTSKEDK